MAVGRMIGKRVKAMLALLLVAACAPDGPQRVVEPRPDARAAARGDALLRTTMLNEQNAARTRAGVPPLAWDATLADHARAYARELARTGRFEHADQPQGPGREGENLWTGTRDAYGYDEMVAHWEMGRAWCRESVGHVGEDAGVAVPLKKNNNNET